MMPSVEAQREPAASGAANTLDSGSSSATTDYKQKYKTLKRKLKFLIYEQECFKEELKKAQRKLLKVSRDKSFLLDRLLQYENIEGSSSDSEATATSSSDNEGHKTEESKRRKKAGQGLAGGAAAKSNTNPSLLADLQRPLYSNDFQASSLPSDRLGPIHASLLDPTTPVPPPISQHQLPGLHDMPDPTPSNLPPTELFDTTGSSPTKMEDGSFDTEENLSPDTENLVINIDVPLE